jgi:hypothetical protein
MRSGALTARQTRMTSTLPPSMPSGCFLAKALRVETTAGESATGEVVAR